MRALKRAASLLHRAAGSAPTTTGLHHPPPGVGRCLAKAFWKRSLAIKKNVAFLTVDDHNTAIHDLKMKNEKEINDLNNKFKKSLLEQKISMNMAMMQLKFDVRKDSDDNYNKHCLDHAIAKNELKILQEKFESHKLNISRITTQGFITKLKNYGWGIGIGTIILARFTNFRSALFKISGKE